MKKMALFCVVAAMTFGVMAGDGMKFMFSSTGDTYADGTAVLNGEVYALVWTASGEFKGFNADGTLVDPVNNDLEAVSVAQGGGCMKTLFVAEERAGMYYLYLLDTRMTVVDENGNETTKVAGLDKEDGKLKVVNNAILATDANITPAFCQASLVSSGATTTVDGENAPAVAATVDESKLDQPVVTEFALADGGAALTVSGTVPYVQYTVYGGTSVTGIDTTKPLATFLNGSAGGTIVLKVANVGENRFFKVATKK